MLKTNGGVVSEEDGLKYDKVLFTYSEDEQEEQMIARETAKLVFSPKFIPFYPELLKLDLSLVEILIFGFIDFYLSNGTGKFYFTNEQISTIVGCSEWTSSQSMSNLKEKGLISLSFKLKSNGGKIRFIRLLKNQQSDYGKINSPTMEKSNDNKNKIKDNKINNNKIILHSESDNSQGNDINSFISLFEKVNPMWKTFFANKTERNACEKILGTTTIERLKDFFKWYESVSTDKYCPVFTKPTELVKQLGKLKAYSEKNHNNSKVITI